jgi:CheY-like chemotaxis protein
VLDIGMPGLNGYEVARRVRADPSTAPLVLIAVTGWGQAADKQAAADAGFDRHLVKPLAPEVLLDVLAALPVSGGRPPAVAFELAEKRP